MNLASPFCHAAYGAGRCVHATYACFPRESGGGEGAFSLLSFFSTATVWCVPFSGAVGSFNKLQTQYLGTRSALLPQKRAYARGTASQLPSTERTQRGSRAMILRQIRLVAPRLARCRQLSARTLDTPFISDSIPVRRD